MEIVIISLQTTFYNNNLGMYIYDDHYDTSSTIANSLLSNSLPTASAMTCIVMLPCQQVSFSLWD